MNLKEKSRKKEIFNPVFIITNMPTPKARTAGRKGPPGFTNKLRQAQIEGTRPFEKKGAKGPPPGFEKKQLPKCPPGFENHIAACNAEFEEKKGLNEHISNEHDEKNRELKQRPIFESRVLKYLDGIGKEPRKLEETYKVGEVLGEGGFGTVYEGVVISESIFNLVNLVILKKISQVTVTQLFNLD